MEKKKSGKRGGRRPGAGRPSLGVTKKVSLTLTPEEWTKLEESGEKIGHWVKKKLKEEPKQTVKERTERITGNSVVAFSLYSGLCDSIESLKNEIELNISTVEKLKKQHEEIKEAITFYEKTYVVSSKSLWRNFSEIHLPNEKSNQKQNEEEKQEKTT